MNILHLDHPINFTTSGISCKDCACKDCAVKDKYISIAICSELPICYIGKRRETRIGGVYNE